MERVVLVRDTKPGRGFPVFLDLPELLPVLEPDAAAWTWAVQRDLEASFRPDVDISYPWVRARIAEGPRGYVTDLDGMWTLARSTGQIVWGEFVAAERPEQLPGPGDSASRVGEHALAGLCAFDSSFWLLGGPEVVIDRVRATFEQVEELAPREWLRG